jgi:HEAT repeat protein
MLPAVRSRPLVLAAPVALALALFSAGADAQPRPVMVGVQRVDKRGESNALRAQMGVPLAQRLLLSDDLATRLRGIERLGALGALGMVEAIDALVDGMDPGSVAARDPRARLVAVRALADEAKRDNVRQLLLREVTDASGSDATRVGSPLAAMVRATAALALARSGDKKAIVGLVNVALQAGVPSDAALRALRAYPPASLESVLEQHAKLTPPLATFLGELGDLRAVDRLRALLLEADPAGKIAAMVALAKLGDEAALPVAREWLKRAEPRLRRAAAEALVDLDAPEAPLAVRALLESDALRDDGVRFALQAPTHALVPTLAKLLPELPLELRPRVVAALGRAGAVTELAPLLDKPGLTLEAAFAIATMPGADARTALERALGGDAARAGDLRRLLARAGVVRALVLDDAPSGLKDRLRALYAESAPADRAVGAFGLTALGWLSLEDALRASCSGPADKDAPLTCDATAAAAARGALAMPDGASSLEPLLARLAHVARAGRVAAAARSGDDPDPLATTFGAALLAHPDGADLPTSALSAWVEAGGPLAPLAARALATRDDDALRPRLKRLLEGSDPVVRAHVALGLGHDPEPSAVSLLVSAYRFEEDPAVRRAIVRGLSLRTEPQRAATLRLAKELDPDEEVRALARGALDGRSIEPSVRPALGTEPRRSVAWVSIQANHDGATARGARIVRVDGLAVPTVADPDGALIVPGLPSGPASLLLERTASHPRPLAPPAPPEAK